jgi:hypothetical protein
MKMKVLNGFKAKHSNLTYPLPSTFTIVDVKI